MKERMHVHLLFTEGCAILKPSQQISSNLAEGLKILVLNKFELTILELRWPPTVKICNLRRAKIALVWG